MVKVKQSINRMKKEIKIAIIGLGYVGLPLARLFATKYAVVGFDINEGRVAELMSGVDSTLEVDNETLQAALVGKNSDGNGLYCTNQLDDIKECTYYIVTVPTPVDKNNRPVLTPLVKASETVGAVLKEGDIVVYESTVYPGATEEECIPVLEKVSGLEYNTHFYAGYSPERINPGDKEHTVEKNIKSHFRVNSRSWRKSRCFISICNYSRYALSSDHKSSRGCQSNREFSKRYQYCFCE
jgi:UDP-N-acetyl-D-galactosamine dehydrogenase